MELGVRNIQNLDIFQPKNIIIYLSMICINFHLHVPRKSSKLKLSLNSLLRTTNNYKVGFFIVALLLICKA